jgi:hypothetical protein
MRAVGNKPLHSFAGVPWELGKKKSRHLNLRQDASLTVYDLELPGPITC